MPLNKQFPSHKQARMRVQKIYPWKSICLFILETNYTDVLYQAQVKKFLVVVTNCFVPRWPGQLLTVWQHSVRSGWGLDEFLLAKLVMSTVVLLCLLFVWFLNESSVGNPLTQKLQEKLHYFGSFLNVIYGMN